MSSLRWKKFFIESALPAEVCENYAVIFSENRIRFDMLDELNKEILYDMGIKKMGDIISILRHAKDVHCSSYREKVFANDNNNSGSASDSNNAVNHKSKSKMISNVDNGLSEWKASASRNIKAADSTISTLNDERKKIFASGLAKVAGGKAPVVVVKATTANNNPTDTANIPRVESQSLTTKRFVVPQRRTVVDSNSDLQKTNQVKCTPIHKDPIIIRNVSGLFVPSYTSTKSIRKRIEAPVDNFEHDVNNTMDNTSKRLRSKEEPADYVGAFSSGTSSSLLTSTSSSSTASTMLIRNRVDAQSRLTNFSKEIHRALVSNNANTNVAPSLIIRPSGNVISPSNKAPIKSRLSLRRGETSIEGASNSDASVGRMANRGNSNRNDSTVQRSVQSRLGAKGKSIKDRLGQSSVFERIKVEDNKSSVFQRLGS